LNVCSRRKRFCRSFPLSMRAARYPSSCASHRSKAGSWIGRRRTTNMFSPLRHRLDRVLFGQFGVQSLCFSCATMGECVPLAQRPNRAKRGFTSRPWPPWLQTLPRSATPRAHWAIANNLHWQRDVTFDEDRSRMRKDFSPSAFAAGRPMAFSSL